MPKEKLIEEKLFSEMQQALNNHQVEKAEESFTKISRSPDLSFHALLHLPRIASSGISQRTGYHSDGDRTGFASVSLLIIITIYLVF